MRALSFVLILLFCLDVHAAPGLEKKVLLDGKMSILVPMGFQPLSQEILLRKYPNPNPPNLVYANERATVSIALTHTAYDVPPEQLPEAFRQVEGGIKQSQPNAKWFRSEMTTINGQRFFLMELRSPASDVDIRNIIVGTSLENRLLLVAFNTTVPLESEWLPVGYQIIQSITLK